MLKVVLNKKTLQIALLRRNLTRKALAREMAVSRGYMSRIISGKKEPSAAIRQRLMDYLKDYTFDDLFTIEEDQDHRAGNNERA